MPTTWRLEGATTCAVGDERLAALTDRVLFASCPLAPALKASVPGPVPFSEYCQVKVWVAPAAIDTGASEVDVLAAAPPVAVREGGAGAGLTPVAVACPALRTVMLSENPVPRVRVVGNDSDTTVSCAGVSTVSVAELTIGALTGAPLTESVPLAPVESWSVPAPAPFST